MSEARYIHGTHAAEQRRLAAFNALVNPSFLEFLELDRLEREGVASVLEVGSGLGILASAVARRLPAAKVFGVELSADQLVAAAQPLPPNLTLLQGDAQAIPLADCSFDVVYCRWVLEHVARPVDVLSQMRRVLKPGGRVFVVENDNSVQRYDPPLPNFENVWQQVGILQRKMAGDGWIGRRLFGLMRAAGFEQVEISLAPEIYRQGEPGLEIWAANEAEIIRGCAADLVGRGLAEPSQIDRAIAELEGLANHPHAAAWFYWNQASGRR